MQIPSRNGFVIATLISLIASSGSVGFAQTGSTTLTLFRELESAQTTNQAAEQLLRLGKTNAMARQYLAAHLPPLIEAGPQFSVPVWGNAVDLAGELGIVNAAPALAKWISVRNSPVTGLSQEVSLRHNPAAAALARIGNPAIPALEGPLERGDLNERREAVYALDLIGSPKARSVLHKHAAHEPNAGLRDFINRVSWK